MESHKSRGKVCGRGRGEMGPTENNPSLSFDKAGGVGVGRGRGRGWGNQRLKNPSPAGPGRKRFRGSMDSTPSPMSPEDLEDFNTAGVDYSLFALDQASVSPFESAEIQHSARVLGTGNNNSSVISPLSEQATNRNPMSVKKTSSSPFFSKKTGAFRSPLLPNTDDTAIYNLNRNFAELPKSECVYCRDGLLRDNATMRIHRQEYHRIRYERCDLPVNHHLEEESDPEADPFICPDCGAEKKTYGDYLKCVKAHQDEMKEKQIFTHVCNFVKPDGTVCGKSFRLRKGLGQHRLRRHSIEIQPKEAQSIFKCDLCSSVLASKTNLTRHKKESCKNRFISVDIEPSPPSPTISDQPIQFTPQTQPHSNQPIQFTPQTQNLSNQTFTSQNQPQFNQTPTFILQTQPHSNQTRTFTSQNPPQLNQNRNFTSQNTPQLNQTPTFTSQTTPQINQTLTFTSQNNPQINQTPTVTSQNNPQLNQTLTFSSQNQPTFAQLENVTLPQISNPIQTQNTFTQSDPNLATQIASTQNQQLFENLMMQAYPNPTETFQPNFPQATDTVPSQSSVSNSQGSLGSQGSFVSLTSVNSETGLDIGL